MKMRALQLIFSTALIGTVAPCGWRHAAAATPAAVADQFGGRGLFVYLPARLPAPGARALVVVLHGGLGNAERIASRQEVALNLDAPAEANGFVVAYLNGTPMTRFFGGDKRSWNAGGGCCGQPASNNVDDVNYISGAIDYLAGKYGIDRNRIYGMGYSNGAMMTQRLLCQTMLYQAGVAIAGPLNVDDRTCPAARGKRLLALHGANDVIVPVAGGQGTNALSGAVIRAEASSRQAFVDSGASYDLQVIEGADHGLDHIDAAIQQTEYQAIPEKATRFFGLVKEDR
jgi:polyhydroxybutyrate depolymerase